MPGCIPFSPAHAQAMRHSNISRIIPDPGVAHEPYPEEGPALQVRHLAALAHTRLAFAVTAVAAYNDDIAATVIGEALRIGLAVPEQLAVIGHDDAPIASIIEPRISTIRVDAAGLGVTLAELAIAKIEDQPEKASTALPAVTLIPRTSTLVTRHEAFDLR